MRDDQIKNKSSLEVTLILMHKCSFALSVQAASKADLGIQWFYNHNLSSGLLVMFI